MSPQHTARADVAIIGSGIAGLWLAHRLHRAGRTVVMLESRRIGSGQTVASQGIIHGGTKYALTNRITGASESISAMPARWRAALGAGGEVDLTGANLLSDCQHLWSHRSVPARIATFFAASVMRNRVSSLPRERHPSLLAHRDFAGSVYRIDELVFDVPSVLARLAAAPGVRILKVDGASLGVDAASPAVQCACTQDGAARDLRLEADVIVCTAGAGAAPLLERLGERGPVMQRRPLHMVLARGPIEHAMYGHCLGAGPRPRITITSHDWDGDPSRRVWYLGGELAEAGVERTREQQVRAARDEVAALLPWIDTSRWEWDAFKIDRAEGAQQGHTRPDGPVIHQAQRWLFAWPTKLAFAPLLADQLIDRIVQLAPHAATSDLAALERWPTPELALPPWKEERTWQSFDP